MLPETRVQAARDLTRALHVAAVALAGARAAGQVVRLAIAEVQRTARGSLST